MSIRRMLCVRAGMRMRVLSVCALCACIIHAYSHAYLHAGLVHPSIDKLTCIQYTMFVC